MTLSLELVASIVLEGLKDIVNGGWTVRTLLMKTEEKINPVRQ